MGSQRWWCLWKGTGILQATLNSTNVRSSWSTWTWMHFHFLLVLVAQSCPVLCDPMDYSPPGSSFHGILQARILEWLAILFSRASSWSRDPIWVFCIAAGFFTNWAIREALYNNSSSYRSSYIIQWIFFYLSQPVILIGFLIYNFAIVKKKWGMGEIN